MVGKTGIGTHVSHECESFQGMALVRAFVTPDMPNGEQYIAMLPCHPTASSNERTDAQQSPVEKTRCLAGWVSFPRKLLVCTASTTRERRFEHQLR